MKTKMMVALAIPFLGMAAWGGMQIVYKSTLDFPLYKNEHYEGDSKAVELADFMHAALKVRAAQQRLQAQFSDGKPRRVFHAKQHGCLTGTLSINSDRRGDPDRQTFEGMFAESKTYDVIVRFSNGVGIDTGDKNPDVRGVAIKVFEVESPSTGKKQTVDFLMTNSPVPFGRDLGEFVTFMDYVSQYGPTIGGALFSAGHPRAGLALLNVTGGIQKYKTKSLVDARYWGGHPYLLGPDKAMKFNMIPHVTDNPSIDELKQDGDNYLRKGLRQWMTVTHVPFKLALQLEKDQASTPIEDNLNEWTEKESPSIVVGDLVLDQQEFDKPEIDHVCENLSFTPGHYLPEHRPLSNMGRGRLFAYEASQFGRGAQMKEPGPEIVEYLRKLSGAK